MNLMSFQLALLATILLISPIIADISFCKCMCFSNYTIVPLYRPKDIAKPCLTCTKQFCLDQKLAICQNAQLGNTNPDTGTGDEGDVRTKCFQRDSAKDATIVIGFIIITTALLLGAFLKEYAAGAYELLRKLQRTNANPYLGL
ncbi:uncharacterized protein MELLADRAFT_91811 [Melampsora larici-populina 98AG31]|uniref:Secreted protein n=1 Tax=Melampsora larici-populina (strain 98AG31 / pathotype 3-4-7) TaxID=747676 RepID=F4S0E3_MELLP|nr:uncharacterized protein MELLADRAFT_91811 [Melampsora larici-populina 98AG31]EGG01950.1 hypothetical protein MELLADRAFT_91811 [Melampsora larici-populina 98AG31]